jgi:hypothetical protein
MSKESDKLLSESEELQALVTRLREEAKRLNEAAKILEKKIASRSPTKSILNKRSP